MDTHEWQCTLCHGPVMVLGTLGTREHGRCRNCGIDQSRHASEYKPGPCDNCGANACEPDETLCPRCKRPPLRHSEGCPDGCYDTPGILFPVNGCEVQRCDECAPDWSDEDAARALRERFPWLVIEFEPDADEEGNVLDPEIGVFVLDAERTEVPPNAPPWLVTCLQAMRKDL